MTTLTIELEDELMSRMRQLAQRQNISVNEMVSRIVRNVAGPQADLHSIAPISQKLSGIIPPMSDEEVNKLLDEHRMHKYGGQ